MSKKETNTTANETANVNKEVTVSNVLEEIKKKDYDMVVVIGLDKKGEAEVTASNNALPMVHWLLNRAEFEMNLFEKQQRENAKQQAASEKKEEKSEIITPKSEIITPK